MHLNVVVLEEDVMIEVVDAFAPVIAAAGIINEIATAAINNNFIFLTFNLYDCAKLDIYLVPFFLLSLLSVHFIEFKSAVQTA